jgi:hypothetical protein
MLRVPLGLQINFRPLKFYLKKIMKCSRRSLFKCRSNCSLLSAPSAVTSSVRPIIYSGGISDPDRYLFVHIYSDQRIEGMENRAEGVSFRKKKVAIRQVGDAVKTDESFTGTQEMADNSF